VARNRSPRAALVAYRARQVRIAARDRAARAAAQGPIPLTTGWRGEDVVLGAVSTVDTAELPGLWNTLFGRRPTRVIVSLAQLATHFVLLGETGSGKTQLLLRLMTGFYRALWARYVRTEQRRPLLLFLDCKGGEDGLRVGARFESLMTAFGLNPDRVAVLPQTQDRSRNLNLWLLSPPALIAVLLTLLSRTKATNRNEEHFADAAERTVRLIVEAPDGPPRSTEEFLERCSMDWLMSAYQHTGRAKLQSIASLLDFEPPIVPDVYGRFESLFSKLGPMFAGTRRIDDFDAVYVTVPGTVDQKVAGILVAAMFQLVLQFASGEHDRAIALIGDELSAVSEQIGLNLAQMLQRVRTMGVHLGIVAHDWESLGPADDVRAQVIDGAGTLIAKRGKGLEPALARYGPRRVAGHDGALCEEPLIDPQRVLGLEASDFLIAHRRSVTVGACSLLDPGDVPALEHTVRTRADEKPSRAHDVPATAPSAQLARLRPAAPADDGAAHTRQEDVA
jgi:hypothetical protein